MDRFAEMLHLQYSLQRRINGYDIEDQALAQRVDNIAVNVLAATDELHELLRETSWKPWTTTTFLNWGGARKEAIDLWHFVMNLFLHLEMSADDVYTAYLEKNGINHQRQEDGYTGIKGKCAQCERDLEAVTFNEVITQTPLPHVILYCPCGREVGRRPV